MTPDPHQVEPLTALAVLAGIVILLVGIGVAIGLAMGASTQC